MSGYGYYKFIINATEGTLKLFRKIVSVIIAVCFFVTVVIPSQAYAQGAIGLPQAGTMINLSPAFTPAILRGMRVYPENSLKFDFIVDSGNTGLQGNQLKKESEKIVKYFLAALTIPEDDLWVNLSPYEENRIIPDALGQTEMGLDLLAQDYILKQIMSSLIYPENDFGKEFWKKVYKKAYEEYGTTNIPIDTFNKVWIVPQKAVIYEDKDKVFITDSYLKVMMEQDYLALEEEKNAKEDKLEQEKEELTNKEADNNLSASIAKEVIIPLLEKEVNEGKNFAQLRQIFHAMVLATWYKEALRNSIITKVYADKSKVVGIQMPDERPANVDNIYDQYLAAYEKGAVNYIKVEYDPYIKKHVTRKYFSGGFEGRKVSSSIVKRPLKALKNAFKTLTVGLAFTAAVMLAAPLTTSAAPEFDPVPLALSDTLESADTFSKSPVLTSDTAMPAISVEDIPSFDDPPLPEDTIGQMEYVSVYDYIYDNMPQELKEASEKEGTFAPDLDLVTKYSTHTYKINDEDIKVYVVPVKGLSEQKREAAYDRGEKGYVIYVDSNLVNDTAYLESQRNIVEKHITSARNSKRTLQYLSGSLVLFILGGIGSIINRDKIKPKLYKDFCKRLSKMKSVRVEFNDQFIIFRGPKGSLLKVTLDLKSDQLKATHNRLFSKTVNDSAGYETKNKIFDSLSKIISQNKNFQLSFDSIKYLIDNLEFGRADKRSELVRGMLGTVMVHNPETFNKIKDYLSNAENNDTAVTEHLAEYYRSAINANLDLLPIVIKQVGQGGGARGSALFETLTEILADNKEIKLKKEDLANILKSDLVLSKINNFNGLHIQRLVGNILSNNPDLLEDAMSMFEDPQGEIMGRSRFDYSDRPRANGIRDTISEGIKRSQTRDDSGQFTIQQVINACKIVSNLDSIRNSHDSIESTVKQSLLGGLGSSLKNNPDSLIANLEYIETLLDSDSNELKNEHLDSILPELGKVFEDLGSSEVCLNYLEQTSSDKMRNFLAESMSETGKDSFDQICRILTIKTLSEKGVDNFLRHAGNSFVRGIEGIVTQSQFDSMFNAVNRFVDFKRNNIDIEALGRIVNSSFASNPNLDFSKENFISLLKYAILFGKSARATNELNLSAARVLSSNPEYFDTLIDKIEKAESLVEKDALSGVGQRAIEVAKESDLLSDIIIRMENESIDGKKSILLNMVVVGMSKDWQSTVTSEQSKAIIKIIFEKDRSDVIDSDRLSNFLHKIVSRDISLLPDIFSELENTSNQRDYFLALAVAEGLGDPAIAPLERFILSIKSKDIVLDDPVEKLSKMVSNSENLTDNKKGYYAQFIMRNHSVFDNLKRIRKPSFFNKIVKSDKEKWQLVDFIIKKKDSLMISSESDYMEIESIDAFDQIVEKKYTTSARGSLPYVQSILRHVERMRDFSLSNQKEDLLDYNNYFQHFSPIIYEEFKRADNRDQFSQATKKSTKDLLDGKSYQQIKSSLEESNVENADDYLLDLLLIVSPNSNASASRQIMKDLVSHGIRNEESWQKHVKDFVSLVDRDIANDIIGKSKKKIEIKENSIKFSNEMLVIEKKLKNPDKISHEKVNAMFGEMGNPLEDKINILDVLMPQEKEKQDQYLQRVRSIFLSWLGSSEDMKKRVLDIQGELVKGSHVAYNMIIETIRDTAKERMQSLKVEEKYDVMRENLIKVLGMTENIAYKNDGDIAQMFKKIVKSTPGRLTKGQARNFEELSEKQKKQAFDDVSDEFSKTMSKFAIETAPNLKKRWGKVADLVSKEYCVDQDLNKPTELSMQIKDIFNDLIDNETLLVAAERIYEDISKKSNEKIIESLFEISRNNSDNNSLKGALLTFMEKYAVEIEDKANLRWKSIADIISGKQSVGWSDKLPKVDQRLSKAINNLLGEASLPFAQDPLNYAIPMLIRTIFNEEIREANTNLNQFYEQAVGVESFELEAMKSPWQALFGTVSNICIFNDTALLDQETLIPIALKANDEYVGYVLLHNIEKNGQKFLLVAGIEPAEKYLETHSARPVYDSIMESIVDLAKMVGAVEVGISANQIATSNRPEISDIITTSNRDRDALGYDHNVGGDYTSNDYYSYWSSKKEVSEEDVLALKEIIPESLNKIIDVKLLLQKDRSALQRIDTILRNKESIPYLEQMYHRVYETLGTKKDAQAIVTSYVPVLFQYGGKPFNRVTVSLPVGETAQGLNDIVIYHEGGIRIKELKDQQEVVLAQGQMASSVMKNQDFALARPAGTNLIKRIEETSWNARMKLVDEVSSEIDNNLELLPDIFLELEKATKEDTRTRILEALRQVFTKNKDLKITRDQFNIFFRMYKNQKDLQSFLSRNLVRFMLTIVNESNSKVELQQKKELYSLILYPVAQALIDEGAIDEIFLNATDRAQETASNFIDNNISITHDFYEYLHSHNPVDLFKEGFLKGLARNPDFRMIGNLRDFLTIKERSEATISNFESGYQIDSTQAENLSYDKVAEISDIDIFLSQGKLSGHLAMHLTGALFGDDVGDLDKIKDILMAKNLYPSKMLEDREKKNSTEVAQEQKISIRLAPTQFVHFSIDKINANLSQHYNYPFAFVTPVEFLLENKSYFSDPLQDSGDWLVGGSSMDENDPSRAVPLNMGIFLVPAFLKDDISKIINEIKQENPKWEPPNKIYYYEGKAAMDGIEELKAKIKDADEIYISRMPKPFKSLTDDGFKGDHIGRESAQLFSVHDYAESYTIANEISDKKRISSVLKQGQEVVLAQGQMISSSSIKTVADLIKIGNLEIEESFKGIAEFLLEHINKFGDVLVIHETQEDWDNIIAPLLEAREAGYSKEYGAYYTLDDETGEIHIFLNPSSSKNIGMSFLHELAHAYTQQALENPKTNREREFSSKINSLYEYFKTQYQATTELEEYEIQDSSEFLAYALTDKEFQRKLNQVLLPKGSKQSIWKSIFNAISNLLGKDIKRTVLDQVLGETFTFIESHDYSEIRQQILLSFKNNKNKQVGRGQMTSSAPHPTAFSEESSSSFTKGGIDFNAEYLDIEKRGSSSIEFSIPAEWKGMNLENLPGLIPASISITPLTNFTGLLGLDANDDSDTQQFSQTKMIGEKVS